MEEWTCHSIVLACLLGPAIVAGIVLGIVFGIKKHKRNK